VFAVQSANRLGRVDIELIFTLKQVVINLNLHEGRFEASIRTRGVRALLRCTAARHHAGLPFLKNEASKKKILPRISLPGMYLPVCLMSVCAVANGSLDLVAREIVLQAFLFHLAIQGASTEFC
jgi:hypothetical protein